MLGALPPLSRISVVPRRLLRKQRGKRAKFKLANHQSTCALARKAGNGKEAVETRGNGCLVVPVILELARYKVDQPVPRACIEKTKGVCPVPSCNIARLLKSRI